MTAMLDYGVPVWSDDVDISPGALRAWAEAAWVLSRQETDRWIAENSENAKVNLASVEQD